MESEIANWIFQAHDSDLNRKDSRTAAIIGLAEKIHIARVAAKSYNMIHGDSSVKWAEEFFTAAEKYAKSQASAESKKREGE